MGKSKLSSFPAEFGFFQLNSCHLSFPLLCFPVHVTDKLHYGNKKNANC